MTILHTFPAMNMQLDVNTKCSYRTRSHAFCDKKRKNPEPLSMSTTNQNENKTYKDKDINCQEFATDKYIICVKYVQTHFKIMTKK